MHLKRLQAQAHYLVANLLGSVITSTEPGDAATMERGTFLGVNSKPPLN